MSVVDVLVIVDYVNARGIIGDAFHSFLLDILSDRSERIFSAAIKEKKDRVEVLTRVYGGWANGVAATSERETAYNYFSNTTRSIFKTPSAIVSLKFELAESLLCSPNSMEHKFRISHTMVERAGKIKLRSRAAVPACAVSGCKIDETKKWIKSRKACGLSNCGQELKDSFYFIEQKQVDTHMVSDLLYASFSSIANHVVVVSSDIDFAPALTTAASVSSSGANLTFIRGVRANRYFDETMVDLGIDIMERGVEV